MSTESLRAPSVGTISRRDREGLAGRGRIVWAACPDCAAERWVPVRTPDVTCRRCSRARLAAEGHFDRIRALPSRTANRDQRREKNPQWRGGRRRHASGYVLVLLAADDPMRPMAQADGLVMEHRLVMARALGRPLHSMEQVHHLNGRKDDNRLQNLELWTRSHPSGVRATDAHCPTCTCGGAR